MININSIKIRIENCILCSKLSNLSNDNKYQNKIFFIPKFNVYKGIGIKNENDKVFTKNCFESN